jgi:PAS domain S-box-containing protein
MSKRAKHSGFSKLCGRAEALGPSEEHYRPLFELNPNPMWIFDEATLRFMAVNEAAVKLYGWSRKEFLRMTIKEVRPPPHRCPKNTSCMHEPLSNGWM